MSLPAGIRVWLACLARLPRPDAYARYLTHQAQHHPGIPVLDRRAFYLSELQRKWNGIHRCC